MIYAAFARLNHFAFDGFTVVRERATIVLSHNRRPPFLLLQVVTVVSRQVFG
ncbi:MAG: hypothetical protein MSG64_06190 [Pyrinomonadaceae bacterium MAG19_C2-C3]|nr:hypothetical protein [Pyrinomonadaceae bacterium MAG19_C2-C3]